MVLLCISFIVLIAGGLCAVASGRFHRCSAIFGVGGCVVGCVLGIVPAVEILLLGGSRSFSLPWKMPMGTFSVKMDALSAFFLVPIFFLCALSAIYGSEYLSSYRRKSLGFTYFLFNLLVAGMALVVVAHDGLLFLLAWELMAISSFFLVLFEAEKDSVREAGWIYLVATHIGTAFLLVMFLLAGYVAGSLDFDRFGALSKLSPGMAGSIFLLAVVGFGTKAGFMPLHVWLPEAHPAAPSHVSAVMSGVMIKTGIYGLIRILTFLGPVAPWWAWTLVFIGVTSGVLGVLFALSKHDVKRLLAYHSVENIGIIAMGLGIGILGMTHGLPVLTVLGFAGALLHVLNHALFKGLLFLGAGAVIHSTGTREIEEMGGLLKSMRWTGLMFLTGAAAICGLPPLNGFVSEFLIYLASFDRVALERPETAIPAISAIAFLALIGGLAVACFTKAFGVIFLGEGRSEHAMHAHEVGLAMKIPMALLAAACLAMGLLSPLILPRLKWVLAAATGLPAAEIRGPLSYATGSLTIFIAAAAGLLLVLGAIAVLRHCLLSGRPVGTTVTWDCGYARPSARMQYTASSFAQPITDLYGYFLQTRTKVISPQGFFPDPGYLATKTPDLFVEKVFRPFFFGNARILSLLRKLQHGHIHLYVFYIVLVLLALLMWKL